MSLELDAATWPVSVFEQQGYVANRVSLLI